MKTGSLRLLSGTWLVFSRRLYLDNGAKRIFWQYGWPWLRLVVRCGDTPISLFTHVSRREIVQIVDGSERRGFLVSLEGTRSLALWVSRASTLAPERARAAALAFVLGLPLIEKPGGPMSRSAIFGLLNSYLEAESHPASLIGSCVALAAANLVAAFALALGAWHPSAIFVTYWVEACLLAFFTAMRVASADFGSFTLGAGRSIQVSLAFAAAAAIVAALVFALTEAAPMLGADSVHSLVETTLVDRHGWVVATLLLAGYAMAFASDLRASRLRGAWRAGRSILVAAPKAAYILVVMLAALLLPGAEEAAEFTLLFAILIAVRAVVDVWAEIVMHAPLWLSGDIHVLREARRRFGGPP